MIDDFVFFTFVITGVLSTVMGSIIIIETTKVYQKALRSKKWASTMGRITDLKVIEKSVSTTSKRKMFQAHVEYEYSVEGVEFKGDQHNIGTLNIVSRRKLIVEQWINNFQEGQEVIIYYNSSKPEKSSLSIGIGRNIIKDFAFGSAFLIIGITLLGLMISILQ